MHANEREPMLLPVAAVRCPGGDAGDVAIAAAARDLIAAGWHLAGWFQAPAAGVGSAVVDVETGAEFALTQDLGSSARGCRLDPAALAELAVRGRQRLSETPKPDLFVVNRFGRAEAEGGGLRVVIAEALDRGIPLLTVVRPERLGAWVEFSGGGTLLPARRAALVAWARAQAAPGFSRR